MTVVTASYSQTSLCNFYILVSVVQWVFSQTRKLSFNLESVETANYSQTELCNFYRLVSIVQ